MFLNRLVSRATTMWMIACASFVAASAALAANPEKPNVIVLFTDDHGYADLGSQDIREDLKTPHLNALSAAGVRMTSGYVSAPQCVPSRAGLLSGRYQNRFGVESNGKPLEGFDLQATIAERLRKAGYKTGMTGKWHLGPAHEITKHGFEQVYYKNANRPGWSNFDLNGQDRPGGPEDAPGYHLDVNSDAACAFIKRHHDSPFFFYCAYRAPHVPLDAPPKYLKRFPGKMPERRRQALAMLAAIDDGVGRIVATLKEHNLEKKTLLFFIGDNGAPLKIHKIDAPGGGPGWDGSLNEPLNGEKGMLSEGGVRVPFLACWPGTLPAGKVYDQPVISLDVAATAVHLAGLPRDPQLDGVNLVPFLTGNDSSPPHEYLYWRWLAQSAIRSGKWKYLRGGSREYLFDLDADKEEKNNLLAKHPEIVTRLRQQLKLWANGLQPPGLQTEQASTAWERYFDHYLDGKLQPPPTSSPTVSREKKIKSWLGRSCTLKMRPQGLAIESLAGKPVRPFITANGLDLPADATVVVTLKTKQNGQAAIAWREDKQPSFPREQIVEFNSTQELQEHRVSLRGANKIVHLRLILPGPGGEVASVKVLDKNDRVVANWDFRTKRR